MTLLLQGVTCVVLTMSVLKIKEVVKEIKGIDIRIDRLALHLASFWLYFISYLIFFWISFSKNVRGYQTALLITIITESISVVLLTYIIREIYSINVT